MIKQGREDRFMRFWILPFLAGACFSLGYLLTHKILNMKARDQKFDKNPSNINYIYKNNEKTTEINIGVLKSDQNNAIGTNKAKESPSDLYKQKIPLKRLDSKPNKVNLIEKKPLSKSPRYLLKAKTDVNKVIFKKLFETLPKP